MLTKGYLAIAQIGRFFGHLLLLIIRLYWGGSLALAGYGKFLNLDEVAAFFDTLNLPFPLFTAAFVGAVELVGGVSLIVGFFSRVMSFLLVILFCVAFGTAHAESLRLIFEDPTLFLKEEPFLYLYASLLVFCFGAGFASFDYWFERAKFGHKLN